MLLLEESSGLDQPHMDWTSLTWTGPASHGENHVVIQCGAIEMATLKLLGDWLEKYLSTG